MPTLASTIVIISRVAETKHQSSDKAGESSSVDDVNDDQSEGHIPLGLGKGILQSPLALFTLDRENKGWNPKHDRCDVEEATNSQD